MSDYWLETIPLVTLWVGVAVLGGVVSYYAIRAWRSSRERTFGLLAIGLLALSIGSAVTWFGLYFMGQDLIVCESGSTAFTAGGFACILVGLRARVG
ncbi:MAG: hypothetical protein L3K17_10455 [Thermoplasmata archaeon]|nr:hypothetical protein [Thermoplasmata archaeon]